MVDKGGDLTLTYVNRRKQTLGVDHFGIIVTLILKRRQEVPACAEYGHVILCGSRKIKSKVEINGTIKQHALK